MSAISRVPAKAYYVTSTPEIYWIECACKVNSFVQKPLLEEHWAGTRKIVCNGCKRVLSVSEISMSKDLPILKTPKSDSLADE